MDHRAYAIAAAGLLAANLAVAASSATIRVTNQTPLMLYALDGSASPVLAPQGSFVVQAGYALGYEFDYDLTASDGGLPALLGVGPFYGPGFIGVYPGPWYIQTNGYEVGFANLHADAPGGEHEPWLVTQTFQALLYTHGDAVAESLSASGHGVVFAGLATGWGFSQWTVTVPSLMQDTLAVSAPVQEVSPVPEPATWLGLLVGLPLLLRRIVRPSCTSSASASRLTASTRHTFCT